jgi:hypothetical protein
MIWLADCNQKEKKHSSSCLFYYYYYYYYSNIILVKKRCLYQAHVAGGFSFWVSRSRSGCTRMTSGGACQVPSTRRALVVACGKEHGTVGLVGSLPSHSVPTVGLVVRTGSVSCRVGESRKRGTGTDTCRCPCATRGWSWSHRRWQERAPPRASIETKLVPHACLWRTYTQAQHQYAKANDFFIFVRKEYIMILAFVINGESICSWNLPYKTGGHPNHHKYKSYAYIHSVRNRAKPQLMKHWLVTKSYAKGDSI